MIAFDTCRAAYRAAVWPLVGGVWAQIAYVDSVGHAQPEAFRLPDVAIAAARCSAYSRDGARRWAIDLLPTAQKRCARKHDN